MARADVRPSSGMQAVVRGLRLPFLTGSVLPVWVAAALASADHRIHGLDLALTTLAIAALHLASNLSNDAADSDNTDRINRFPTPFSGGSRVLLDGTLTRRSLWLVVSILVLVALVAGVGLTLRGRPLVWLFGAAGGLLGLTYSLPGAQLMARGLGELAIFISFGPLLTVSSGYALTGAIDARQIALGALPGFLITAVLWINQFPDREADAAVGKRNLVVRLSPKAARAVYVALMLGPLATSPVMVAAGTLPVGALAVLLATPLVLKAVHLLRAVPDDPGAVLPVQGLTIAAHAAVSSLLIAGLWIGGRA